MMSNSSSFRYNWGKMSLPPNPESTTIRPVSGTNAFLTKSFDGSIGLYLQNVTDPLPKRRYKHLTITMLKKRQVPIPGGKIIYLRDVLFLSSDLETKPPILSLILEGLHEQNPSGFFTAFDMISVLDDVEELLRRPKALPTIEEVAGAWGELYILRLLLQNTTSAIIQRKILSGWEGEIREKLDFRFLFAMQVLEIKTTMSNERIHHLHGIEQVSIPSGFDFGTLVSICVQTDVGFTCESLLNSIESIAVGTEDEKEKFRLLLSKRILVRGPACSDNRYSFDLLMNGLRFYDFSQVPRPGEVVGVTPIEWLSDLSDSTSHTSSETDNLISRITHSLSV